MDNVCYDADNCRAQNSPQQPSVTFRARLRSLLFLFVCHFISRERVASNGLVALCCLRRDALTHGLETGTNIGPA